MGDISSNEQAMPLADFIEAISEPVEIQPWMRRYIIDALTDLKALRTPETPEPAMAVPTSQLPPMRLAEGFGDPETLLNSRDWLRRALESARATVTGGGCGCGQADLDIDLEGFGFNVSIRPRMRTPETPATTSKTETLCEDCPPVGYPTDKTRCTPCPRRTLLDRAVDAMAALHRAIEPMENDPDLAGRVPPQALRAFTDELASIDYARNRLPDETPATTSKLVVEMSRLAAEWQDWAGTSPHRCERGTRICLHCRARATVNALRDAVIAISALPPETGAQPQEKLPLEALVSRFLGWKLPKSVCSDLCVTHSNHPHERSGTNLLTADEARQMLEHVLGRTQKSPGHPAPAASGHTEPLPPSGSEAAGAGPHCAVDYEQRCSEFPNCHCGRTE